MVLSQSPVGPLVDTRRAPAPEATVLRGRDVSVMSMDPHVHGPALYRATHGDGRDALWLYLRAGPFANDREYVAYLETRSTDTTLHDFAIVETESSEPVGVAAYLNVEPAHRRIEVGSIIYSPPFQRSRGATEAMYLMARHAFEALGYRRYEWKCNALNVASRQAAIRLGFTFEGVLRQHMIIKGRSRDTAWYSMIDTEWPRRRARLEEWLHPGNFDGAGTQRVSLSSLPL